MHFSTGQHPSALAGVLGLMSKVQWYAANVTADSVDNVYCSHLLVLAAANSRIGWKLDVNLLRLRLASMQKPDQLSCVRHINSFLNRAKYLATFHERCKAMQLSDKIPADVMVRLQSSLAALEQALIAKDPMMPQHLRNTHGLLISYPETVHLLDDSEIARIIDAAEVHTKTEIVKAAAAGKGAGSRKKVTADDL